MAKRRDVWSLKIMAWEGHEVESAALAAELIAGPCATLGIDPMMGLVLHADNGGPMTGSTMVATVERLGLLPPFSRPSVNDDTPPSSEALFRTLTYRPAYPDRPFCDLAAAGAWVEAEVLACVDLDREPQGLGRRDLGWEARDDAGWNRAPLERGRPAPRSELATPGGQAGAEWGWRHRDEVEGVRGAGRSGEDQRGQRRPAAEGERGGPRGIRDHLEERARRDEGVLDLGVGGPRGPGAPVGDAGGRGHRSGSTRAFTRRCQRDCRRARRAGWPGSRRVQSG